jgi:elongation factor 3
LRGPSGAPSQKLPGQAVPLKAATSQKLEAELSGKMSDLKLEEKGPDTGDAATDVIIERLLGCTSHEARVTAAKELVDSVSAVGVVGLGSLGVVSKLAEALTEVSKVGHKRAGALVALDQLLETFGSSAEPWTLPLLEKVLDSVGHKAADVRSAAAAAANKMFDMLSEQAVRLILPAIFKSVKHDKEAVKLLTLSKLSEMACSSKKAQLALELYEVVPVLAEVMWDADDEVVASATETLAKCCDTAGNRDLAPFAKTIIQCIATPADVPECVHKLAATVFVQEIRSPALAVTVPLLQRGLNDADTVIRRKACTIVDNMCKMIEQPEEAVAFMPKIMPMVPQTRPRTPGRPTKSDPKIPWQRRERQRSW